MLFDNNIYGAQVTESVLNDVPTNNVIPGWASVEEGALYVIESSEQDFNAMMMNIGVSEITELNENCGIAVQEAGKIKGLIDKVVEWLKGLWGKIKGLYDKALAFLKKKNDEFKGKVNDKILKAIPDKLKKLKDKEYGKTYEFPEYDGYVNFTAPVCAALTALNRDIDQIYTTYTKTTYTDAEDMKAVMKDLGDKCLEARAKFVAAIGASGTDPKDSEISTKVTEIVRGNEVKIDKNYITTHYADMVKECSDFNNVKSKLKKSFATEKKYFDNTIKIMNASKKVDPAMISTFLPHMKWAKHMSAVVANATLSAVKQRNTTAMGIIVRLLVAFGKDVTASEGKKEEGTSESTVIESGAYQSEIASLFNFNF